MNPVVEIDLRAIKEIGDLHDMLANTFGFPHFYGRNLNALIDCWGSLRVPEDKMTNISVRDDECLLLMVKGLSSSSREIFSGLISAVEAANSWEVCLHKKPVIHILPVN